MTTYRKRGTEVDAFRWDGDEFKQTPPQWATDLLDLGRIRICTSETSNPPTGATAPLLGNRPFYSWLFFDPPSGKGNPLVCNPGDWIVRNARGDVFPMTAEKFAETYEASGTGGVSVDGDACSFCGKPPREVKHLVAAATGARICNECLQGARLLEP